MSEAGFPMLRGKPSKKDVSAETVPAKGDTSVKEVSATFVD
jgi:hypothetical protein